MLDLWTDKAAVRRQARLLEYLDRLDAASFQRDPSFDLFGLSLSRSVRTSVAATPYIKLIPKAHGVVGAE